MGIRVASAIVALASLPATGLTALVLLSTAFPFSGLTTAEALIVSLAAVALPVLCVTGALKARHPGRKAAAAWGWLAFPLLPLAIILAIAA